MTPYRTHGVQEADVLVLAKSAKLVRPARISTSFGIHGHRARRNSRLRTETGRRSPIQDGSSTDSFRRPEP